MLIVRDFRNDLFGPIDLDLHAGECVTVEGVSGTGKSLFLRGLADLDETVGAVSLSGRSRESFRPDAWRRTVAYLPAESGWWADRVGEHFPTHCHDEFALWAARLGLTVEALDWQVDRLSSGERHRLALARTFMTKPSVLLLDEPTASLDKISTKQVELAINDIVATGVATLIVTHDVEQAARLGARRHQMEGGRLIPGNAS